MLGGQAAQSRLAHPARSQPRTSVDLSRARPLAALRASRPSARRWPIPVSAMITALAPQLSDCWRTDGHLPSRIGGEGTPQEPCWEPIKVDCPRRPAHLVRPGVARCAGTEAGSWQLAAGPGMARFDRPRAPLFVEQRLVTNERAKDVERETNLDRPDRHLRRPRRRLSKDRQSEIDERVPCAALRARFLPNGIGRSVIIGAWQRSGHFSANRAILQSVLPPLSRTSLIRASSSQTSVAWQLVHVTLTCASIRCRSDSDLGGPTTRLERKRQLTFRGEFGRPPDPLGDDRAQLERGSFARPLAGRRDTDPRPTGRGQDHGGKGKGRRRVHPLLVPDLIRFV